jgi:hypothetical protein
MSVFWIFEFRYDRADHRPGELVEPSERLPAWWTDHRSDVQEAFAVGARLARRDPAETRTASPGTRLGVPKERVARFRPRC